MECQNQNLKKYLKYKTKYLQLKSSKLGGGRRRVKGWTNKAAEEKVKQLEKHIGKPTHICKSGNQIEYVMWQEQLDDKHILGEFHGVDMIKVTNFSPRKLHPYEAPVYVIAGMYTHVPDHLFGPLKYASETINIEQLYVPIKSNKNYIKTKGDKSLALVTGSCASITISIITVNFAIDMIDEFKNKSFSDMTEEIFQYFREEYDKRIKAYLCGEGIVPKIDWFDPETFGEEIISEPLFKSCLR